MAYQGKRVYGERSRGRRRREGAFARSMARVFLFPALLVYLELVLHIYMKTDLGYLPIYLLFGLSGGLVCSMLALPFRRQVNSLVAKVLAVAISLIFIVEIIAKKILQSYYSFSSLGMAAGNRLGDYADVIGSTVLSTIPLILLVMLPSILLCVFGDWLLGFERLDIRFAGLVLAAAAVFHVVGLGVVHLPWNGELTPAQLYRMDSNMDDQVEQLGLWTMLRLDVKHMIFPPSRDLDADFSGLEGLGGGSGSSSTGDGSTPEAPDEPELDTSPNVMDVDLAAVAAGTDNEEIQWLANYFNSVTPTRKNEYTGMFEGYNVIFFTLEGFSGYAIDPELTPTLYKLANEGFVFNNFYTPLHFTSTSGGECQNLLGLYPKNGNPATLPHTGELGTNLYFSLAQQLGREGYLVQGYHANSNMYKRNLSHPNLGYDWHQFGVSDQEAAQQRARGALTNFDGLELNDSGKLLWPQRDSHAITASVDNYIHSDQPFHVYYLTISGHMPYSNNRIVSPYREIVRQLPYSETTQNYIATAMEVDKALETLLDELEAAGKLDNTVIVAAPDHIPYFDVDTLEELAGETFGSSEDLEYLRESNINFDVYKSSLIIWSASMEEPVQVDKVVGQVDILPTLSNLLGLEYDSRMMAGKDALSDSEGLVVFSSRCWMSDRGFYNSFTKTFTPVEGVSMTQEEQDSYVSSMRTLVGYQLSSTEMIVENDFYNVLFGAG